MQYHCIVSLYVQYASSITVVVMWCVVVSRQSSPAYVAGMSACHQRAADNMVEGAVQNGGLYVKLGQGLCAFNHLLPPEYVRTLRILEDKALNRRYKEVSSPVHSGLTRAPAAW